MFSNTRKVGQQITHRLISGHCALVAWWTLKEAGVLAAIADMETNAKEGLEPRVHAVRKNMAPDLLLALVDYLASAGLLALKENKASLTADGRALLEQDDGVVDFVRAYQPALASAEHLLAKLKLPTAAGGKRSEALSDSRARRLAPELLPALEGLVTDYRASHLLDLQCGSGELLVSLAKKRKGLVAVGIAPDDEAAHRANGNFAAAGLEKRLIAVPASPTEVLLDTPRTFERMGISKSLWAEIDFVYLPLLFSEGPRDLDEVSQILAATRKHFSAATIVVAEPTEGSRLSKNYYAAEFLLLLRLTRAGPWTVEQWREAFAAAKLPLSAEVGLNVDGVTLFISRPAGRSR